MNEENETPHKSAFPVQFFPSQFRGGLQRYFEDRIETGSFLRAVLENDLIEAVARADSYSRRDLTVLVTVLIHHAPAKAWGSREKVAAWLGEE